MKRMKIINVQAVSGAGSLAGAWASPEKASDLIVATSGVKGATEAGEKLNAVIPGALQRVIGVPGNASDKN